MYFLYNQNYINVQWTIYRGVSKVEEDFRNAKIITFIASETDRIRIDGNVEDGSILLTIPENLEEGVYALEAIWTKNDGRSISRARYDKAFAVTTNQNDATDHGGTPSDARLYFKSSAGTYGYDGLSAYEIAVLKGKTTLSENQWIALCVDAATGEIQRVEAEHQRQDNFQYLETEMTEAIGNNVETIEQTFVSEESGGVNIITINKYNGESVQLEVRNGIQGEKGDKGDKGETGDSGYAGAAEELQVVNNLTEGGTTAALSAEMGKRLKDEIDSEEWKDVVNPPIILDWNMGMFYNLAGEVGTKVSTEIFANSSICCTFIPVCKGDVYTYTGNCGNSKLGRAWALTDNNYILLDVAEKGAVCQDLTIEIQEDGFLFMDIKRTDFNNIQLTMQRTFDNAIRSIAREETRAIIADKERDYPSNNTIIHDGGELAIFSSIGVCGDSLSSGSHVCNNYNTTAQLYDLSWPKFLERKMGRTVYCFGRGGLAARDFFNSTDSHVRAFDYTPCQCYFIALMHNDQKYCRQNWERLGYQTLDECIEAYVGTENDIDTENPDNNADSFYGHYAKIIQRIKQMAPYAKIFPILSKFDSLAPFNAVVRKMAYIFNNVYPLDMHSFFPKRPAWHYTEGHGNTMGYKQYGDEVATVADWIIRNNRNLFTYVAFINTQYQQYIPIETQASIPIPEPEEDTEDEE